MGVLATLDAADGFLLLHPAQLTLGYKPSLAAHSAEDTALYNFLAKPLEQLILAFIWA